MSTNRLIRGVAAILRETADLRAHYWRYEVSGTGWAPLPELAALCSCCNRRTLQPVAPWASQVGLAVRFCRDCDRLGAPMVMAP
jgi:hypothetical protein